MNKRKIGDEIIQGMKEAVDYVHGEKTNAVTHKIKISDDKDVKKIHLSNNKNLTGIYEKPKKVVAFVGLKKSLK